MTRYIDADALIPMMKYATTDNEIGVFPIRIGFDAIKGIIDEAPTIDAVEVVRCKDCKWSDWYKTLNGEHRCYCMEHGSSGHTDDDYCSYGEREESEVEE